MISAFSRHWSLSGLNISIDTIQSSWVLKKRLSNRVYFIGEVLCSISVPIKS